MANILEYVLSLHDKMSGKLNSIGFSSDSALNKFAKLESQSLEVKQTMEEFGGSIGALRAKLELLRNEREWISGKNVEDIRAYNKEIKNLEKEITKLETLNGGRIKKWQEDFVTSLPGVNLIKNPLVMAGAAVGGFWSATQKAMDAGKEKIKLQTLTGSEEIGASLYKGLTDFATDTVFGSEVYDMGVQMLANGIKDSDIMPLMEQLGDISMGDSNKLGQLSLAFAQVSGKGKLAGQELLQMINAGFNPLQVISDKTGESMESLQAKMSKGEISVQQVQWAMEQATGPGGKFYNMLEKVADTPYGQLENLKGQFEQMVITLGETFLPIASKVMSFFSWLGEKLGPLLQPVGGILAVLSVGLLAAAAAQWVLNLAVWSFPGTWIIMSIVAIGAGVAIAIKYFDKWGATILMLTGPLGRVISLFVQFYRHWEDIKNAFKVGGIGEGLKSIGRTLLHWVLDPVRQVLNLVSKIPGGIGRAAKSAVESIDGINAAMDKADAHNRYLAKLQETKDKIAKAKHDKYLDKLQETKDKIAKEKHYKYLDALYKASGGKLGKSMGVSDLVPTAGLGLGGEGANGGGGAESGSKTNEAITTGGTKNTVINMTIGNVVETVAVSGRDFRESAENMEEEVANVMMRVLAMATVTAN
ncbi:MAG: tape measure protein [Chitinophagales bacterium]|nr:tape measure protein [Chitinophagales bacterium]